MTLKEKKIKFEKDSRVYEQKKLSFHGAEGYDVYNCSIPFYWNGDRYMFGRVEKRTEWARSVIRLFKEIDTDEFAVVPGSMIYQLEDPCISIIHKELVLGGTFVRYSGGKIDTYYGHFYRGEDVRDLAYFTTGPKRMKDIRLVELSDGKIGVFSRPRGQDILKRYGSESMLGFDVIDSLNELTADRINQIPYITGLYNEGEWGGCNQAYLLEDGLIGCIGHGSYPDKGADGKDIKVYVNTAFVINPKTRELLKNEIIATRNSYPAGDAKVPHLIDCTFTSGIIPREDNKVDLYAGLGDCEEGRIVIDNPFMEYGNIVFSHMGRFHF